MRGRVQILTQTWSRQVCQYISSFLKSLGDIFGLFLIRIFTNHGICGVLSTFSEKINLLPLQKLKFQSDVFKKVPHSTLIPQVKMKKKKIAR